MSLSVSGPRFSLPRPLILISCWLLPFIIAFGAFDLFFFNSFIANSITLTRYPTLYVPLIAFPHILSSLIIFFSSTQDKAIQQITIRRIAPLVLLSAILFVVNKVLFDLLFLILLTQHIAGQTFGILRLLKLPISVTESQILKYLNYPALMLAFLMIYCVHLKLFLTPYLDQLILLGWVSLAAGSCYTLSLVWRHKLQGKAWQMFILAQLYFLGVYLFSIHTNIFYWGLVFILGHDVIAVLIYQNYYQNKLKTTPKALLCSIGIPLTLSIVIISLALKFQFPYIVFFFQFAHYIAEKYCWKHDSPLRQHLGEVYE